MTSRDRIRAMADGTMTCIEIAQHCGISVNRVQKIVNAEGLNVLRRRAAPNVAKWTRERDRVLTRMWKAGALLHEIAKALDLPEHQVAWRHRALTARPSSEPAPCLDPDTAFALAMKGRTFTSIKVSPDHRRMPSTSRDAGRWASSMELNA